MEDRIESNPNLYGGKPVIKGTRILVTDILSALSNGDSFDTILDDFPDLNQTDIDAAIAYGSKMSTY